MIEKKPEKLNKKRFWLDLWRLLIPYHGWLITLLFITIVFEFLQLLGPYILKLVIDILTDFSISEIVTLVYFLISMLVAESLLLAVDYIRDRKIFRLIFHMETHLHEVCQQKLLNLSLSYHEKENTGNKIIKIEKGIDKISELFGNMSYEVVPTLIQIILTLGAVFWANWYFAASFIVFSPIFLILTYPPHQKLDPKNLFYQ